MLEHVRHRDPRAKYNVVRLREYMYFRSHLCISFDLLSINMYDFLKRNHFQGLPVPLIRRFAVQIIVSLRYLKALRILHCDLKPENILLRHPSKSAITVIDFGSSCYEDERVYTYIQSRFYRCPEVMLGLPYSTAIDMWSLGCILAELYTGYPIFPGDSEADQMLCIMEIMGVPPPEMISRAPRAKHFFTPEGEPKIVPNTKGRIRTPGTKKLGHVLRCEDPVFLSFLRGCLHWDPDLRLTPDEAMKHPWFYAMRQENPTLAKEGGGLNPPGSGGGAPRLPPIEGGDGGGGGGR